jgi:hypothetical protein
LFSYFLPLIGNYSPVIRQLGEDFVANMRKWVGEQLQSCKEFANTLASAGFVKFYDAGNRRTITIEMATKAFVETTTDWYNQDLIVPCYCKTPSIHFWRCFSCCGCSSSRVYHCHQLNVKQIKLQQLLPRMQTSCNGVQSRREAGC